MPVFVVKLRLNGRIIGYTPHSSLSVRAVVPPVSIVTSLLIFFLVINNAAALPDFSLILLNVLIPSPIPSFGLRKGTMDVTLLLLPYLLICTKNISRCFRYAGCIGSFWFATNGLLQGDPLSVVILNCILCPLVCKLSTIGDLSVYAFADDLTVVSSSWDALFDASTILCRFSTSTDPHLNLSKCQLWSKGSPYGQYPSGFDQFTFCFYPFLLGRPIDIGVPYEDSLCKLDNAVLTRAKRIAKLPLPYVVSYRLFIPLLHHVIIIMHFLVV